MKNVICAAVLLSYKENNSDRHENYTLNYITVWSEGLGRSSRSFPHVMSTWGSQLYQTPFRNCLWALSTKPSLLENTYNDAMKDFDVIHNSSSAHSYFTFN